MKPTIIVTAALLAATLVLMSQLSAIHAWEKASGFPYGMLCDWIGTCTPKACYAPLGVEQ